MSDQFVAEIRIFPFNFAPTGWGQLLPISQNTALFSLLGTYYGGNGQSTFALPNLQGNAPMQPGQGPGLSLYDLGESGGSQTVTLLQTEMPAHTHVMMASNQPAEDATPGPSESLGRSANGQLYQSTTNSNLANLAPQALSLAGSNQPHNNMQPYLTLNFCIALQGIFPPRG